MLLMFQETKENSTMTSLYNSCFREIIDKSVILVTAQGMGWEWVWTKFWIKRRQVSSVDWGQTLVLT